MEWDTGPSPAIAQHFANAPLDDYRAKPKKFRLPWGPIYYRGRTDGSAKVLLIGQDPAADENVTRRILVGHAGQRVQGFLAKLGITKSYVMVNSVLYSIYGQFDATMKTFMKLPTVKTWRNQLLDLLVTPKTEVIIAFGLAAKSVVDSWPGAQTFIQQGRVFYLTHPTARDEAAVLKNWSGKLVDIASKLTPDPDGVQDLTKYVGPKFKKTDLAPVPLIDLAFGSPQWLGTGNTAIRLSSSGKIPASAKKNPTILFIAISEEG